jgi:hypothetical protein
LLVENKASGTGLRKAIYEETGTGNTEQVVSLKKRRKIY